MEKIYLLLLEQNLEQIAHTNFFPSFLRPPASDCPVRRKTATAIRRNSFVKFILLLNLISLNDGVTTGSQGLVLIDERGFIGFK